MTDAAPPPPDAPFPAPPGGARLLLTTAPPDVAQDLAHALVEERLAACVSLVPGVRSVYRWKDRVQDDPETQLLVKTTTALPPGAGGPHRGRCTPTRSPSSSS